MITLDLQNFMMQVKDRTIQNVGAPSKSVSAKLFDVTRAEAREFGDNRVKLEFADADGNEVQISLFPEAIASIQADLGDIASRGHLSSIEVTEE